MNDKVNLKDPQAQDLSFPGFKEWKENLNKRIFELKKRIENEPDLVKKLELINEMILKGMQIPKELLENIFNED